MASFVENATLKITEEASAIPSHPSQAPRCNAQTQARHNRPRSEMPVSGLSELLSTWFSPLALIRVEPAQPLRIPLNTLSISTDYSIARSAGH